MHRTVAFACPYAPAGTSVPRTKSADRKMALSGRSVDGATKIATRPSSGRRCAVDSLLHPARQQSKSSLRHCIAWRTMRRSETLRRGKPESPLEAFGIAGPNYRVNDARRPLAVERIEHLLGGNPAHVGSRFSGHPGGVRAGEHVVELQQRMIRRRRLLGPDV